MRLLLALREAIGLPASPSELPYEEWISAAGRVALGEIAFAIA
jgi:hypothetical protein